MLPAGSLKVSVTLTPGSSPEQASSSPVEGEGRLHGSAGGDLLPRVWRVSPNLEIPLNPPFPKGD